MSTLRAICVAAALVAASMGQAGAAVGRHWSDSGLGLALTYPADWRAVPERGAALKLAAPDAAGEFEIFSLPSALSPAALASKGDAALARLHCALGVRRTASPVGRLGVAGATATGTCTGADLGWQLTVTVFNRGAGAVLTRSWLFHRRAADGRALAAITASLAPAR